MIKNVHYIIISMFFILVLTLFLIFTPESYLVNITDDSDFQITKNTDSKLDKNEEIAVIIDENSDTPLIKNIISTLSFLRLGYITCDSVYQIGSASTIIYASSVVTETDIAELQKILANGGNVIFAVLPDNMTDKILSFLEITEYIPDYETEGFDIYDGILIEKLFRTNDIKMSCAKVNLTGRCKVYVNGHSPNRDKSALVIDRNDENPLIWRTYYEKGAIFVINAPFMEDIYGTGILTGILSLVYGDFIYPIVGTKTVLLNNFPFFLDDSIIINNRTPFVFSRDIIWPDMYSIARRMDIAYVCFANGNFTLNNEAYDTINFFTKELYKMKSEFGYYADGSPESFNNSIEFTNKYFPQLSIKSLRTSNRTNIDYNGMTSVIEDTWDDAFEWISETTVKLPVISEGIEDEYTTFKFSSIKSAIGIAIHEIEMAPVFTGEKVWNDYSVEITNNLSYLFNQCRYLESANLKKTTEFVKNYLNLDMTVKRTEKSLNVSIEHATGETTFILRTEKTIGECFNCIVSEIEAGIYMVKSSNTEFTVYFK